jgi:hypothetical protein
LIQKGVISLYAKEHDQYLTPKGLNSNVKEERREHLFKPKGVNSSLNQKA